ncbi:MAG: FecR family protein, partial [Candidatus Saccharimonadales bacterium]
MSRIDMEELFDRYLNGEALPEEAEKVETWLNVYQTPRSEWQEMDKPGKDRWLAHLYDEIAADAGFSNRKVVIMRMRKIFWGGVAAAAAVIAIFFALYLERPVLRNDLHLMQLTTVEVPLGQKTQVALADGSKVWINEGSELRYPKVFTGKTREVYLSGEAYFDIRHNAAQPFIIHTGKILTTVLGTAFNIKEDKQLHTVVVTVTRGKVSVANGKQALGIITPNQQISFNELNYRHTKTDVDAQKAIVWQESYIHFNDITFAEAAAQLQQRFNVRISFANGRVKNCRFTGAALKEEKLDKILKVICAFNDANYKIKADGSIVI